MNTQPAWSRSSQGEFVRRHGTAHAQARVGVDVVGAEQALRQFVEDVVVLGQQLTGYIKPHCIGAMGAHNIGQALAGHLQSAVPADGVQLAMPQQAALRLHQTTGLGDLMRRAEMELTAFAAQSPLIGWMPWVALDIQDASCL
jgi:hypothetical protein